MKVSKLFNLFGLLALVFALGAYPLSVVYADHGGVHQADEDREGDVAGDDDDNGSRASSFNLPAPGGATGGAAASTGICTPGECNQHGAEMFWASQSGTETTNGGATGGASARVPTNENENGSASTTTNGNNNGVVQSGMSTGCCPNGTSGSGANNQFTAQNGLNNNTQAGTSQNIRVDAPMQNGTSGGSQNIRVDAPMQNGNGGTNGSQIRTDTRVDRPDDSVVRSDILQPNGTGGASGSEQRTDGVVRGEISEPAAAAPISEQPRATEAPRVASSGGTGATGGAPAQLPAAGDAMAIGLLPLAGFALTAAGALLRRRTR